MSYAVAIISADRPQNVEPMQRMGWSAGVWFVPVGQGQSYLDAGAGAVYESGGLCESRNVALESAFIAGAVCIQVSDDLTKIETYNGVAAVPATADQLITAGLSHVTRNCRLVGVAPTANAFYASTKVKRRHFVVGDFMVIAPSTPRFDERLKLKEDYDFTAQHLRTYGEVARLDWWLLTFKHRTNKGGAVAYRTPELEQESIALLREKWGTWIRPNSKRPNEVLFRPV